MRWARKCLGLRHVDREPSPRIARRAALMAFTEFKAPLQRSFAERAACGDCP